MPEERKTFMQELDEWTHKFIVERLHGAWQEYLESGDPTTHRMLNEAIAEVKQSIREKVLESYRNGQKAGPSRPQNKQQK